MESDSVGESANHQLVDRMVQVKAALELLEQQVLDEGAPRDALEDFKHAVDHIRISLWAILSAERTSGHRPIVAHYRLQRATDLCSQAVADVEAGEVRDVRDVLALYDTVVDAGSRLALHVAG